MRGLSAFSGYGWIWLPTHIDVTTDASPDMWELVEILTDASVETMTIHFGWGSRTFKTASHVRSYIYKVFERLPRLWMGIWLNAHTVTTADASPDLESWPEVLPDASVQTMPLCFDWGCRTFQNASHVRVIPIWGVWAPSQVVDGHMASHSHRYHQRCFPRFVRGGQKPTWCKCAIHATKSWLRL